MENVVEPSNSQAQEVFKKKRKINFKHFVYTIENKFKEDGIMKKYLSWILSVCFMFTLISFNGNTVRAEELPLNFADSNLNNVFCDFVGKAHGSSVYKTEIDNKMQQLYTTDTQGSNIDLNINGVSDLSGIEQLKDLSHPFRYIAIRSTVNSLDPIKDFSLLKLALINPNNYNLKMFNDSSVLQGSLQVLYINPFNAVNNPELTDISPISKLSNLKVLHIYQTNVSDISAIQNLSNLETLMLDGLNRWSSSKVNISLLKSMPALKNLSFARLNLTKEDLKVFSETNTFTNLKLLTILNESQIQDISYLKNRIGLNSLTLWDCGIDDSSLNIINTLTGVSYLNIGANQIKNIEPLRAMTQITNLTIDSNQIENIDPIGDLVNLKQLFMKENYVTDISPLTKLNNLQSIDITNNFVDVFNTEKDILNNIKASLGITSDSQRAVIGKKTINMNVGDSVGYNVSAGSVKNYTSNDILAELKQTSDGKTFTDYYYNITGDYKFSSDNTKLDINNTPYHVAFKATAPGEMTLTSLFRNIDSPLTKVNTKITIIGAAPIVKGSITIKYQDESGTDIGTHDTLNNLDLGTYTKKAKSFEGCTLNDISIKSVTLTDSNKDQTIIFRYKKNEVPKQMIKGSITIKYQEQNRTDIGTPEVSNNLDLGTYTVSAKSFDGYTLDGTEKQSVTLIEDNKDQVIIFKYKQNEAATRPDRITPPQEIQSQQDPQKPEELPQTGGLIDSTSLMIAGVLIIILGAIFTRLKNFTSKR